MEAPQQDDSMLFNKPPTEKQVQFAKAMFKTVAPFYDAFTFGGFSNRYRRYFDAPITQRLQKIDEAKAALAEALEAIDDLQAEAETNSRALNQLQANLQAAEQEKSAVAGEVQALKSLAEIDADTVRKVLKLPTTFSIWRGHVLSFLLGIVGSLIASGLWSLTPWGG
jgi:predicted ribosome quality control (RQC) complex YloA/Tae2 family protein